MISRLSSTAVGLLLIGACEQSPPSNPAPGTTTAAPASAAVAPPARPNSNQSEATEVPPDTWLLVRKDGIELGTIELRKGKPPKLALAVKSEAAAALATRLEAVGGPQGIGLDMHIPPPDGKGRGPLGTEIVKWDSERYRHALEQKLEPEYDVKELPFLPIALPPEKFRRLEVSHAGKKLGTIEFSAQPPKLAKAGDKSEAIGLQNDFERIVSDEGLRVRFHHAKDGAQTLVDVSAKPGEPNHAYVAALYLMVERSYQPRYTYALEFVP